MDGQGRRNPLASPRLRRRLRWSMLFVSLAATVAGLAILFPSPAKRHEVFDSAPVQVSREPSSVPVGPRRHAEALLATMAFVRTAVVRHNLDASWDLAAPSLRVGYTRKQWATGDIPVVPFPAVGIASWQVDWSYKNDMGFDVVLVPRRGSRLVSESFMVELRRSDPHGKWRVASWVPHGVSVQQDLANASAGQTPPRVASSFGGKWLLLPLILFALVFLAPLCAFGVRGWLRQQRAERAYRASLRS